MSKDPTPRLVLAVLAATLAGFAYLGALHNPFAYDDSTTIVGNASLRNPGDVGALLRHSLFRPVVNLSYALDHAVWGLRPFGYHLTSVLLHMLNVALLFTLAALAVDDWERRDPDRARRLDSRAVAFAVAALFALHPMMTEAVGYVSGRSEVLCGTFFMLAVLAVRAAIVGCGRGWMMAGVVAAILGIGSREVGAMLPFVLLAWDRLLLADDPGAARRRLWRLHVPLIAAGAVLAGARLAVFVMLERPAVPLVEYVASEVGVVWRYLGMLVVPVSQTLFHHVEPVTTAADVWVLIPAALLAAVGALAWQFRRVEPLAALGAAWFFVMLAPSSLVPLGEAMAEHRVYLASAGVFLVVGVGWARLLACSREPAAAGTDAPMGGLVRQWRVRIGAVVPIAALAVVLTVLGALTVARNAVWSDPVGLARDAAEKSPRSWRAHFSLGNVLADAGNCKEAIDAYREAARLSSDGRVSINLGNCLAAERRLDEAARVWQAVLVAEPTYVPAHYNLALLALESGDRAAAQRHFLAAIGQDPTDVAWRQILVTTHASRMNDVRLTGELCRAIERAVPGTPAPDECPRGLGSR